MNILSVDFMSFTSGAFEQTWGDRLIRKTIRKIRRCGNHGNSWKFYEHWNDAHSD